LVVVYRTMIAPVWAYLGFPLGPWNPVGTALGVMVASVTVLSLPRRIHRLTAWWRLTTWALVLVPAAVVPWQTGWWSLERGLVAMAGLLGAWTLFEAVPAARRSMWGRSGLREGRRARALGPWALFAGVVIVTGVMMMLFGLPRRLPTLFEIYIQRAAVRARVGGVSAVVRYLIPWGLTVVAPGVMAWGMVTRRRGVTIAGACFIVLLFAWTAQKAALLPLLVLPAVIGWGRVRRWRTSTVLAGLTGVVMLCVVADLVVTSLWGGQGVATSIVVRRGLIVPGLLYAQYAAFFDLHGYTFWADGVLRAVGTYPFERARPILVGTAWVPKTAGTMWANGSWWADAWSHAGLVGLWCTALVGGLLRAVMDWTTRGRSPGMVMGVLLFPILALANSGFSVTLLTHGLLAGWALAIGMPGKHIQFALDVGLRRPRQGRGVATECDDLVEARA
jgi:hypothetical protein